MAAAISSSGVDMVTLVSLLERGATRLARLLWIPTLDLRLLRFLLTSLAPASPGALRSTLSPGALRCTRQQVTIPVFRGAITAPPPCCVCIHVMRLYMRSFCAQRGAAVSHNIKSARVSQRAHEKEDLTTSRIVRVIYSSHGVYNRVGIVSVFLCIFLNFFDNNFNLCCCFFHF